MMDGSKIVLEWRGDVQRVRLVPGDVLVVRITEPIPMAEVARLKEWLAEMFPDNRALILHGMEAAVSVVKSTKIEEEQNGICGSAR